MTHIPIDQYHADATRASKSALDMLNRSPYEYWCRKIWPTLNLPDPVPPQIRAKWGFVGESDLDKTLRGDDRHFELGNDVDCLLLEHETWSTRFFVTTRHDRRYTQGKKEHFDLCQANVGKKFLTHDEHDSAVRMVDAIKDSWLHMFVDTTRTQNTFHWTDPVTGVDCKCRPDWLLALDYEFWERSADWLGARYESAEFIKQCIQIAKHHTQGFDEVLFDIKTLNGRWNSHVVDYRYHVQDPFYIDGIGTALDDSAVRMFAFMVVNTEWPHTVSVKTLPVEAERIGRSEYQRNLAELVKCRESDHWPRGGDDMGVTEMPGWFMFANRNLGYEQPD